MGLEVNTVKPKPSGVGVRSLGLEATGRFSALGGGGVILGPARKKHSFSGLPEDQGTIQLTHRVNGIRLSPTVPSQLLNVF